MRGMNVRVSQRSNGVEALVVSKNEEDVGFLVHHHSMARQLLFGDVRTAGKVILTCGC